MELISTDANVLRYGALVVATPLLWLSWRQAQCLGPASPVIKSLLSYITFAFLIMGLLLSANGGRDGEPGRSIELAADQEFISILGISLYSFVVIACCLQTGIWLRINPPRRKFHIRLRTTKGNLQRLQLTLLSALIVKFLTNYVLGWGVPALVPTNTIPLVTGFSVYLVRDGILLLIAFAIYYSRTLREHKRRGIYALIIAAVSLDVFMGSKFLLMGLAFVSAPLVIQRLRRQEFMRRTASIGLLAAVAVLLLVIYQAANTLRFLNLDDALAASEVVRQSVERAVDGGLWYAVLAITERVTGAESVVAASAMSGLFDVGISDIFLQSDFGTRYTAAVTGVEDENLAVGATLAATYTLVCNNNLLCLAGTSYSVTLALLIPVIWVIQRTGRSFELTYALALVCALTLVHAQLSSGALIIFANRLIVVYITAAGLNRLMRVEHVAADVALSTPPSARSVTRHNNHRTLRLS